MMGPLLLPLPRPGASYRVRIRELLPLPLVQLRHSPPPRTAALPTITYARRGTLPLRAFYCCRTAAMPTALPCWQASMGCRRVRFLQRTRSILLHCT